MKTIPSVLYLSRRWPEWLSGRASDFFSKCPGFSSCPGAPAGRKAPPTYRVQREESSQKPVVVVDLSLESNVAPSDLQSGKWLCLPVGDRWEGKPTDETLTNYRAQSDL